MFRRKDEDVAQDLLGNTEITAQTGTSKPEEASTKSGPVTAQAAPPLVSTASPLVTPSYRPTAEATKPRSPAVASGTYRPVADAGRGRVPEYRPSGGSPLSSPISGYSSQDSTAASKNNPNRRVLTVGHDILLKGEIATCDRLVIEGSVDATLHDVHTVEIAEGGAFKGAAEIEDAEISGLFEGELIVRNRLVIYNTGKVRGKITFGEIEIERGGELTGEIRTFEQADAKGKPAAKSSGKTKQLEEAALAA